MNSAADCICRRVSVAIADREWLTAEEWRSHAPSQRFVDIVTGGPALYDTRVSTAWDEEAMYVRFDVEEPFVEARLQERGAHVFTENAVEIMIDGGDCYYELAVNALGTVYEVFHVWKDAYRRGGKFDVPEFDLVERNVLTFGGDYDRDPKWFWRGTHERGCRWSFLDWTLPGLRVRVDVQGLVNDPTHVDRGWIVEMTLPWNGLHWLGDGRAIPPRVDDEWRIYFGRIQWLTIGGDVVQPSPIWVVRPHGTRDPHQPEAFPRVLFAGQPLVPEGLEDFEESEA